MSGGGVPAPIKVIGHNIDPVDNGSNAGQIIIVDIRWACPGSNGQQIGFSIRRAGCIQLFANFLQQQYIVFFIFRTVAIACESTTYWIFPVEIHAVHLVFSNKINRGIGKNLTGRSCRSYIRETVRPGPASNGD